MKCYDKNLENLFDELVSLIWEYNYSSEKRRYGHTVLCRYTHGYYFEMDSYSKSIVLYKNDGKRVLYLGTKFGGFELHHPESLEHIVTVMKETHQKSPLPKHFYEDLGYTVKQIKWKWQKTKFVFDKKSCAKFI